MLYRCCYLCLFPLPWGILVSTSFHYPPAIRSKVSKHLSHVGCALCLRGGYNWSQTDGSWMPVNPKPSIISRLLYRIPYHALSSLLRWQEVGHDSGTEADVALGYPANDAGQNKDREVA